jgi:hypothetical protein
LNKFLLFRGYRYPQGKKKKKKKIQGYRHVWACDGLLRNDVRIIEVGSFDEETGHDLRFALILAVDLRGNQSFVSEESVHA